MFKEEFVKETYKVNDYIDINATVTYFGNVFEAVSKPCLSAVLGDHGSGKSTMLYQLKNKTSQELDWVFFDAWKYPRRSELWEGFVTELARELDHDGVIIDRIKGKSGKSEGAGVLSKLLEAAQSISGVPALKSVGDLIVKLFEGDPITKLEGFQELLKEILVEREKPVYIVVEDIDRSKDQGIFFIETLRYFLNKYKTEISNIVVIVPMSEERYENGKGSYLKCFDIVERFSITNLDFSFFVSNGLIESSVLDTFLKDQNTSFDLIKVQISSFLNLLVRTYHHLTIREIKLILRNANKEHRTKQLEGLRPDYRVSLCIEAMKWIAKPRANNMSHWLHSASQQNITDVNSKVFSRFLSLILAGFKSFKELTHRSHCILDIEIVDKDDRMSSPLWSSNQVHNKKGYLQSSYFY